jgi:hypothetical protein
MTCVFRAVSTHIHLYSAPKILIHGATSYATNRNLYICAVGCVVLFWHRALGAMKVHISSYVVEAREFICPTRKAQRP